MNLEWFQQNSYYTRIFKHNIVESMQIYKK